MNLSLELALYFAEEPGPFDIAVGLASSMQLSEIIQVEGIELKQVILVFNDDELAKYFTYNNETNTIDYFPNGIAQDQDYNRQLDDATINKFEGTNLFQLKLVD